MERWTILFGSLGFISHSWRQCPNRTSWTCFCSSKLGLFFPILRERFDALKEKQRTKRIGKHFIRQNTTFEDLRPGCFLDLFFNAFATVALGGVVGGVFFYLSLKYLLNEGTTSNPVELCCFLWHIALERPCSPATQIVVTPGAWWFEDLSGRRMAQKTTRGFAPISRVLYVFVLILFE